MADPVSFMAIASTVLSAAGPVMQGVGAAQSANSVASQYDAQANSVAASAQRAAANDRKQGRLAQSRLQALAGGGGLDPTVVKLAADIAGETEYRALSSLYEGDDRAAGLRFAGDAKRAEGKQARIAGVIGGVSSVLGNSPGLLEKYGKGGFDFAKSGYGGRY